MEAADRRALNAAMVRFADGLMGMTRRYHEVPGKATSLFGQLKLGWSKPSPEKQWTWISIVLVADSLIGWFGYVGVGVFVILLFVVLIYEWRNGALDFGPDGKKILKAYKKLKREGSSNEMVAK